MSELEISHTGCLELPRRWLGWGPKPWAWQAREQVGWDVSLLHMFFLFPHPVPGHPVFSAEVVNECCPLVVCSVEVVQQIPPEPRWLGT